MRWPAEGSGSEPIEGSCHRSVDRRDRVERRPVYRELIKTRGTLSTQHREIAGEPRSRLRKSGCLIPEMKVKAALRNLDQEQMSKSLQLLRLFSKQCLSYSCAPIFPVQAARDALYIVKFASRFDSVESGDELCRGKQSAIRSGRRQSLHTEITDPAD